MGYILKEHIDKLYDEKDPTSMSRMDKVLGFLIKLCGSVDSAMDILQEVIKNLYDRKDDPDDIESVESFDRYLFGCLRHEFLRQKREADKEKKLQLILEGLMEEVGFSDEFLQEENEDIVRLKNILDNLNPIDLRILMETIVNGVKCPMLAKELNEEGLQLRSEKFSGDNLRQQKLRIIKKIKAQWMVTIK